MIAGLDLPPKALVLDVATGTGLVARDTIERYAVRVIGLDQSAEMIAEAAAKDIDGLTLVRGDGQRLPFPDGTFDALTFTYLLRYVDDPAATVAELARVVRPGGVVAGLEFGVPRGVWRPFWELYVRVGLPVAGRVISPGWHEVGTFLGPSIRELHARLPIARQLELWSEAGIEGVRVRRLSLGGGYVIWGRKA